MEDMMLTAIFVSTGGFILALAGKAWAVSRKSRRKNEFFSRLSVLFLILMFILLIFYRFII